MSFLLIAVSMCVFSVGYYDIDQEHEPSLTVFFIKKSPTVNMKLINIHTLSIALFMLASIQKTLSIQITLIAVALLTLTLLYCRIAIALSLVPHKNGTPFEITRY